MNVIIGHLVADPRSVAAIQFVQPEVMPFGHSANNLACQPGDARHGGLVTAKMFGDRVEVSPGQRQFAGPVKLGMTCQNLLDESGS